MASHDMQDIKLINPSDIEIGKHLGTGGFGSVSFATHKAWGDVAIKEFADIK